MIRHRFGIVAVFVAAALVGSEVPAAVTLAPCFGDHMVLQQGRPLAVWGTADPGERIAVRFASARATATTGADRSWRVALPPQQASSIGRPLVVEGRTTLTIADVLVGEVWLCAGQSNMLVPLATADDSVAAIAGADDDLLRLLPLAAAAGGDPPAYTPAQVAALGSGSFISGTWTRSSPAAARSFSAVAFFFARRLRADLDTPVGVIQLAVGGAPTEAWIARDALAAHPETAGLVRGTWLDNPDVAAWCRDRAAAHLARAVRAGEPVAGDALGPDHPFKPGYLWTAGLQPLAPFSLAGACWYQGESNAETSDLSAMHEHLLPILIHDWRRAWGRDDLPFAVVQLPGMERPHWPEFREGQRRACRRIPHAGLIVTIDLGRAGDVHPPDKRPVGERLAAWATTETRGQLDGGGTCPLPRSAEVRGDGSVAVRFDHASGLKTTDGLPPRHFELGRDGRFEPAVGVIDGVTVVVEVPGASGPWTEIRSAWAPFPRPAVNLVNGEGLPASPFILPLPVD